MEKQPSESHKPDTLSVLIMMYEQSQQRRQHHETMRLKMALLFTSFYAILGTIIASEHKDFNINYICIVFLFCSIFGLLFTLSYTERANLYYNRGCVLREKIDDELKAPILKECTTKASNYESPDEKFRLNHHPSALRHHILWIAFHIVMVIFAFCIFLENYIIHTCCKCGCN